jgi:hypothetical protein
LKKAHVLAQGFEASDAKYLASIAINDEIDQSLHVTIRVHALHILAQLHAVR